MIYQQVRRLIPNVYGRRSPRLLSVATGTGSEQGLTLIECLVALVVIALTVGSVTPALVISVATRVQSQKAEQAIEIAQSEIDAVRTLLERGTDNYDAASVPAVVAGLSDDPSASPSIEEHLGPISGTVQAATVDYTTLGNNQVRAVDVNGDGDNDFGIQVYRTPGQTDAITGDPIAFTMGVRVYDIRAINAPNAAINLATEEARIGATGSEGERSRLPLATVYSVIARGDSDAAYCDYIEFLGSTPATDYPSLNC